LDAGRSARCQLRVGERDLLEALAELHSGANELTRTLLGGAD
jgi:hypothetical protein